MTNMPTIDFRSAADARDRDDFRADFDAMMRVVWWAVGLTLATGIVVHRAGLLTMHEPAVIALAAALQVNSVCAVWLVRRVRHAVGLYFAAHLANVVLVSAAVHYVGGVRFALAPLLYTLIVANGGIVGRLPAHVLALVSWIAYATVVALELSGVWPSFVEPGIPATTVDPAAWPAVIAIVAVVLHVGAAYAAHLGAILRVRRRELEDHRRLTEAEITSRLRALDAAEQARAENRALRRESARYRGLVHVVTHDLKTPINAIYITADLVLARRSALAPETREAIERIRRTAEATEAKVVDLMKLFRVVTTAEPRAWIDLNQLVRDSLRELHGLVEAKAVRIDVERLPVIWGEREKLGHAVTNLLSNAVKYVRSGHGRVRVSGHVADGCTAFAVEDNGIGIPDAYHERIFELFARVPETEQDLEGIAVHGTGVGLALVRQIVESHHGTVRVRSVPDGGSRFEVRLPVLNAPRLATT